MFLKQKGGNMNIKLFKLQKILVWIPYVNYFVFFIWAWNQIEFSKNMKRFVVSAVGIITLISMLICGTLIMKSYQHFFDPASILFRFLFYYVQGIMMGGFCVLSQKFMLSLYDKQEKEN